MKYLKLINVLLFFTLCVLFATSSLKEASSFDGFYKRKEIIITKGEDRIELTTNIDVLSDVGKYTSIIKIIDVNSDSQYTSFSIDGDMYSQDGLLIAKTNKVEETESVNKPVLFVASSSPIASQIQKSLLGINIYEERFYKPIKVNDFFCYYDLSKQTIRCMY